MQGGGSSQPAKNLNRELLTIKLNLNLLAEHIATISSQIIIGWGLTSISKTKYTHHIPQSSNR
jgi:hypothetical protein